MSHYNISMITYGYKLLLVYNVIVEKGLRLRDNFHSVTEKFFNLHQF